jgi:hypothetical protein
MQMSTVQPTSDNRLLAVVHRHGARLAQVLGPATIQPHHWPAVNLAMLGAIDDATAQLGTRSAERIELDLIRSWLEANCQERRLASAPISDQVMDLIAWQQDEIEILSAANKRQDERIAALLDTVRTQDQEIAKQCSTNPLPCIPITVVMASSEPAVTTTSNAADPMPLPASMPVTSNGQHSDTSALPASGRTRTRTKQPHVYSEERKADMRRQIVDRIRELTLAKGKPSISISEFEEASPDLPMSGSFTKTLGVRWTELVREAGATPLPHGADMLKNLKRERTQKEATAASTVAVPFPGAAETGTPAGVDQQPAAGA